MSKVEATASSSPTLHTIQDNLISTMTNNTSDCEPYKEKIILAMSVVPALVAIENAFVLVAMLVYWHKLKHNNVYRYVASCLAANIVSSVFGFYHFLNYYHGFEPHQPNQWWAFRKG